MGTEKYEITLWVALEEELAIMQLFHGKGWPYIKFRNDADKGLFTAPEGSTEVVPSEQTPASPSIHLSQTDILDSQFHGNIENQGEQISHTVIVNNNADRNDIMNHEELQVEAIHDMTEPSTVQEDAVKVTYLLEDGNTYCVSTYPGDQFIEGGEVITEETVDTVHLEDESPVYVAVKKELELNKPSTDVFCVKDAVGEEINPSNNGLTSENDIVYKLAMDLTSFQNADCNQIIIKGRSLITDEDKYTTVIVEQEKENKNNALETQRAAKRINKKSGNFKKKTKSMKCGTLEDIAKDMEEISKVSLAITNETDGVSKLVCCMCNKDFDDASSFEDHADDCLEELTHRVDSTLFKCKNCQTGFKHASTLLRHRLSQVCQPGTIQRTGESLTCKHCGKLFRSERLTDYTIHLLKHRKERAHVCELCGKTFLRANTLRDHKRNHTGERPFVCRYCPQGFTSAAGRVNHEKTNHLPAPKRCVCDKCGASFKFSKGLDCHIKEVHNAEYKYKCEHCDMTFKRVGTLNRHKKRHSDTKDKVCTVCGKGFHLQSDLKLHMKRHTNERTLFCKECNKGFYTKQTLNNHVLTHTGEKPYECSECAYRCINRGNLNKHMRVRHPELTKPVSVMGSLCVEN